MIDFIPGNLIPKIISNSLSPGFSIKFPFALLLLKLNSSKYTSLVLFKSSLIGGVSKKGFSSGLSSFSSGSITLKFLEFSISIISLTDNNEEINCSFSILY